MWWVAGGTRPGEEGETRPGALARVSAEVGCRGGAHGQGQISGRRRLDEEGG